MSKLGYELFKFVQIDDKNAITNLLSGVSPGLWTKSCPPVLDDTETLQNQVTYLFSASGEGSKLIFQRS